MSFEDDMKFANDVLRIRNEMIDETIFDGLPIRSTFSYNFKIKTYSISGKSDRGSRIFGDISSLQFKLKDANSPSLVTSKSIVYIHDDLDAYMTIGKEQEVPIIEFDEATYFQYSMIYTSEQLRMMVTLGVLRANPIMLRRDKGISPFCLRFKIFTYYVPILAKLLRYKDNGIL